MASLTRATVLINKVSQKPLDSIQNVWHFVHLQPLDQAMATKIGLQLAGFYGNFQDVLSASVSRIANSHSISFASVAEGAAGAADDVLSTTLFVYPFSITGSPAAASLSLPAEVAVCMSFQSTQTGIPEQSEGGAVRPAARRRGRVYLGPFNSSILADEPSSVASVKSATRFAITSTYEGMITQLKTGVPNTMAQHVVYSRTSGLSWPIAQAWVDNGFDTVRSRGEQASTRTTVNVIQAAI